MVMATPYAQASKLFENINDNNPPPTPAPYYQDEGVPPPPSPFNFPTLAAYDDYLQSIKPQKQNEDLIALLQQPSKKSSSGMPWLK